MRLNYWWNGASASKPKRKVYFSLLVAAANEIHEFICFCLLFDWWVMAACRGKGLRQEKRTKTKNKWMNEWNWRNKRIDEGRFGAPFERAGRASRSIKKFLNFFNESEREPGRRQTTIHQPSTMKRFSIVDWFVNWWGPQLTHCLHSTNFISLRCFHFVNCSPLLHPLIPWMFLISSAWRWMLQKTKHSLHSPCLRKLHSILKIQL